jgi:hypothetical protein
VPEAGAAFEVTSSGKRFQVTLTRARIAVQALYLSSKFVATGTERDDGCYGTENVVGQVRGDLDLDLLNPNPQAFPVSGDALERPVLSASVWLGRGPINEFSQESNQTVVFAAEGSASRDGTTTPFRLAFTIDLNRRRAPRSSALPGTNLICQLRIVDRVSADFIPTEQGKLTLRVDPRAWFRGVDFDDVAKLGGVFADEPSGPSVRVFDNMRTANTFALSYVP